MMDAHLMANLLTYCAQAACLALVSAGVARLVRIDSAAIRYGYWRAVLALCLVLPWIQGRVAPASATVAIETAFTAAGAIAPQAADAGGAGWSIGWPDAVAAILAVGVVLRLAWIGAGLVRLRRLRRAGQPAQRSALRDDLQWAIGTRAEIRHVPGLSHPATFGARAPVVLLPGWLADRETPIERAILAHELFHVRRRDWAWTIAEELVRALLWFSPGIWWLVSRVQLAREEVVDELTVLATGERRTYMEALLAFADAGPGRGAPLPVAAFARRNHLFRRMVLISKEAVMSSKRVVSSCAAMALVVGVGAWVTITTFPLAGAAAAQELQAGPGPLEQSAKPITPENPIPRRTASLNPVYPAEAAALNLSAMVVLRATLDRFGRIGEVRALTVATRGSAGDESAAQRQRALDALRQSAMDAVRQWQYDSPADGPISFDVMVQFSPGTEPTAIPMGAVGGRVFNLSPDGSRIGGPAAAGRTGGAAAERIGGAFGSGVGGAPGAVSRGAAAPPPPPPAPLPPGIGNPVRVGGAILAPTKTRHVPPVYPAIAQSSKVQGVVILEALIGPDGRVVQTHVLRSIPLLDQAAIDAVSQWEFTPTLLNGVPVAVIMTVTVSFSLT
jgi:TonB family protein